MDEFATARSSELQQSADDAARQQNIVSRLERLPFHRWHVKMRVIIGTATFFDGLDAVMIAYILPALVPLWKIKPAQIGFLISSGYIGQLLGSLFFGWYAERKGRLPSLSATVVVFSIASFLCTFSWAYAALFTFRFIQGFGLGGEVPVAATYINELAKAKGRGKFVLLYELVFTVGLTVAAFLGWWVVPRYGWRVMFLIGAVVGLIVPVLRRRMPESPRWLASRRRFDEAEKIVDLIEAKVSENGRRPLPPVATATSATEIRTTHWREFFQGVYLRRTLTVWIMWFTGFFCAFGLLTWLPTLYSTIYKLPLATSLKYTMITQIIGLVAGAAAAFLIDRIGRRKLFTGAFIGLAASFLALWQLGRTSAETLLTLASCAAFFYSFIAIALWVYTPEIYPTRMRAWGCGIGTAWYRVAVIIAPIMLGLTVTRSLRYAFLMFGLVAAVGAIVTGLFATETTSRILEEVSP